MSLLFTICFFHFDTIMHCKKLITFLPKNKNNSTQYTYIVTFPVIIKKVGKTTKFEYFYIEMLINFLQGLVTKYPDMRPEQLVNLLMCRGDLSRADARQVLPLHINQSTKSTRGSLTIYRVWVVKHSIRFNYQYYFMIKDLLTYKLLLNKEKCHIF